MFVVVEGPNGSGKTSLIKALSKKGYQTLSSPNGTPLAKILRPACRGTGQWTDIDKRVQFMLFSAARLDEYIRLVKDKKEPVIADRWWSSTYVYQCTFQGLSVDFMEHTIHPDEKIDLVIRLDADDEVLINRVLSEREKNPDHGKCRWTQDRETMKELIRIYREMLPEYLSNRGIKSIGIDTTGKTKEEIVEIAEKEIIKYATS
ncbi:MAG: dTMP kinase [Synergistaceae bacterium]